MVAVGAEIPGIRAPEQVVQGVFVQCADRVVAFNPVDPHARHNRGADGPGSPGDVFLQGAVVKAGYGFLQDAVPWTGPPLELSARRRTTTHEPDGPPQMRNPPLPSTLSRYPTPQTSHKNPEMRKRNQTFSKFWGIVPTAQKKKRIFSSMP